MVFFYKHIETTVTNEMALVLDVYCQGVSPFYKCHNDEACVISSWPMVHLQPGETKEATLYLAYEQGAELTLSIFASDDVEYSEAR